MMDLVRQETCNHVICLSLLIHKNKVGMLEGLYVGLILKVVDERADVYERIRSFQITFELSDNLFRVDNRNGSRTGLLPRTFTLI